MDQVDSGSLAKFFLIFNYQTASVVLGLLYPIESSTNMIKAKNKRLNIKKAPFIDWTTSNPRKPKDTKCIDAGGTVQLSFIRH